MPRFLRPAKYATRYLVLLSLLLVCLIGWVTLTGYSARLEQPKKESANPNPEANVSSSARANKDYGKLPLSFEVNRMQADPAVRYLARGPGYSIFLSGTEAALVFQNHNANSI